MTHPVSLSDIDPHRPSLAEGMNRNVRNGEPANIGQRMEQMLWTEMLSHAGLEDAFTQGGGEAASAFSRFIVEEIAKDLAAKHPLGIGKALNLAETHDGNFKPGDSE